MFAYFLFSESHKVYPIAGYNHGAQNYERVKESIQISIKYAALLASLILFLFYYATPIVSVLLPIQKLLQRHRMPCVVFPASPYC
jgi:Na+-driven multidrug efflux pump